ncbi:MAG: UDP-N-acetylmuramoyl-tripeptide--D-alanyl-D-alanine ligase [Myxococcales bacterium]|nr:UDP-N-acetylmuramoyl-tripeptide--D-alanyl-D-alanine ligase [Myxococcales bacterium]
MKFDARRIAAATGGRVVGSGAAPAGPVVTDTRTLRPGDWFLALVGDRFDGHTFLERASASGAVGCVVDREPGGAFRGDAVIVPDTTRALQDLGRHARQQFRGPVIGVTGSSGKTTTRALLALALSPLGEVHQTKGNLNNHLGVPMTLIAAPEGAAAMVVEMGTSSPGEIGFLAELGEPDVRLIVNVGPAHLEELGGLPGVAREKGAMFRTARPGDVCCVNVDDPYVRQMELPAGVRRIAFGTASGDASDAVRLTEVRIDPASLTTHARYQTPQGEVAATIPAPGHHVALNAAGALAAAVALGIDPAAAAAALSGYQPVGMRMRPELLPSGATALNDAYNANPQSMKASLGVLAAMPGRRAAILGDMLELGPDEAEWHRTVAREAGEMGLDLVVFVGPRMSAAASACVGPEVWSFAEVDDAIPDLSRWAGPSDVLLFKGSRGASVEQILQGLLRHASPADDRNGGGHH